MPVESDSAESPIDPAKLVLLVDIANFRPRDGAQKVFLRDRGWRDIFGNEKTNLRYVNQCLLELEKQAPGAIVISFCDHGIGKTFESEEDWIEIKRRSQLSSTEPNKIFFTRKKADYALIRAANELGSPIVSHDGFVKEKHGGIVFVQSFDVKENVFHFTKKMSGRLTATKIGEWWADQSIEFTDEWLQSTERDAAEFRIRQRVDILTFDLLVEEKVTHSPDVPENALQTLQRQNSEREARREQRRIAIQGKVKSFSGFTEPETVIYADEWSRLEEYQGRVVTLIGRLVDTEDGQFVEWFKNFRQISMIGDTIPETYGKDRFVVVTGRLEEADGVQSIHLDPAKHVGYRWFADVVAGRPIYLQDEDPLEDFVPENWRFPSFVPSLSFVRRLRWARAQGKHDQSIATQPTDPPRVTPTLPTAPKGPTPYIDPPKIALTPPPLSPEGPDVLPRLPSTPSPPQGPDVPPTPPPLPPQGQDVPPTPPRLPPKDPVVVPPSVPPAPPKLFGDEEPIRKGRKPGLLFGVGIAMVVAIGFGVSKYVMDDSTSVTVPGRQVSGVTPCPKTDGAEVRATVFEQAPTMCIDPEKQYTATFDTSEGVIEVALDTKKTPLTVNNFVTLSRYKYYDKSFIFRTDLSLDLIQGGGSNNTNSPGYSIKDEGIGFEYTEGDLVMARSLAADSGGGQFFFATGPKVAKLNVQGDYVTFGKITKGLDVAQAILELNVGEGRLGGVPSRVVRINTVVITER